MPAYKLERVEQLLSVLRGRWRTARSRAATIDDEMRADDVARQIRAQIHHRIRHFLWRRIAPSRRVRTIRIMDRPWVPRIPLRLQRAHHPRLDRAGTYGVHSYAQAPNTSTSVLVQSETTALVTTPRPHATPADQS